jgi:hypothetical protein
MTSAEPTATCPWITSIPELAVCLDPGQPEPTAEQLAQARAELYTRAGIDLTAERVVGVGSVCRRQATGEITTIVASLADAGIRLHGFGVKTLGLRKYWDYLTSADSLAWSYGARRAAPLPGCLTHMNCANCARYALAWHLKLQRELDAMPRSLWSLEAAS